MFYAYHRSSHEVDWLWHIHKTHHYTRHPTPILVTLGFYRVLRAGKNDAADTLTSSLPSAADEEQEFLEIFAIPLAAALITSHLVPFSFQEWFISACGVVS